MITEAQKTAQKKYRDNMSGEQKERYKANKRAYGERLREELKLKRSIYYQANKESMNESSRAYHQKERELKASMSVKQYRNLKNVPKPHKVLVQPADKISLKEIAEQLGVIVALIRAISKDKRYGMPEYQLLRIDGAELYDRYEISRWIIDNNEMLVSLAITGMSRKNKGAITIADNVLKITEWLQASKHVTKYCNTQRVAINSNQFWSRWA